MYILGALDSETNKYVTPVTAEKGRSYKCIDCQQKVLLRKGTIRVAHFAHYSQTNTCTYYEHPNESQLHKDAKLKMAEWLKAKQKIEISSSCPKCLTWPGSDECDEVNIDYKDGDETVIEYRDPLNKYVADVALLNDGKVRYIFEIKHTHATTTDVRPEPWYEFTTECIRQSETNLNNPDPEVNFNNTLLLTCVRQSMNRYCNRCIKDLEKNKLISAENERYRIELQKKREQEQIERDVLIKKQKIEDELLRKQARSRVSPCVNCGAINYCTECKTKFNKIYNELKEKNIVFSNCKGDGSCFIQENTWEYRQEKCKFNCIRQSCEQCSSYLPKWVLDCNKGRCGNCKIVKTINNNEILENLPVLLYRTGVDNGWKQERKCVECGRQSYSPVYENRKNYAVCKICFDMHKESILSKIEKGEISNKQECLIMDD